MFFPPVLICLTVTQSSNLNLNFISLEILPRAPQSNRIFQSFIFLFCLTIFKLCAVQFIAQLCQTPCNPMNRSTPGLPVHHQLPEFTQTHVRGVRDAIQPSHPLSSPSPPAPNPSQHQSLFQWVNSSYEVAKLLEFQLLHHSFQRTPRADLL